MKRGKYPRNYNKGLSVRQEKVLNILLVDNPTTLPVIRLKLALPDTGSITVSLTRSLARLRERNLIKSLGRNSNKEHLWVITEQKG